MKRGTQPYLAVAVLGICLWLAAGCRLRPPLAATQPAAVSASGQPVSREQPATQVPRGQWASERYADLPVPKGYRFEPSESFVFVQRGLRSADLKYEGHLTVAELIRFYQEAMPTNGWTFLRMTGVRMKTITFVKGDELCEILILSPRSDHIAPDGERAVLTNLHIKLNRN